MKNFSMIFFLLLLVNCIHGSNSKLGQAVGIPHLRINDMPYGVYPQYPSEFTLSEGQIQRFLHDNRFDTRAFVKSFLDENPVLYTSRGLAREDVEEYLRRLLRKAIKSGYLKIERDATSANR